MESDHRTGFVDFDDLELFWENTEDPIHNSSRKLSIDYPESIIKYLEILKDKIKQHNIKKALSELLRKAQYNSWIDIREQEYNNIDTELTTMMLHDTKECIPKTTSTSL